MLLKFLKGALKGVVLVLKLVTYPIYLAYKHLSSRNRRSRRKERPRDFPGIYIVSNSADTLKIGRSKHVNQRLKQYRGYQADGQDIHRLLIVRCPRHKELEARLH